MVLFKYRVEENVMGSEIVKYDNDFNNQALRRFTSEELNLLMTIFHKLREKETNILEYSFYELKKLIMLEKNMTVKEFANTIMNVNKKLLSLNYTYRENNTIVQMAIFKTFKIKLDEQILMISLNEDFRFLLNDFNKEWTRFELEEFVNLKSSYTKEFYRRMKQFKNTGFWNCSLENFKHLLDIPATYRMIDIDTWVLKPIKKELGEKYNLQIKKKYGFTGGRGRSRVVGFEFRFLKDSKEKIEEAEKMKKNEDNKTKTENKKKEVKVSTYPPKFLGVSKTEEKKELSLREKISEKIEMIKDYMSKNNAFLKEYTKNGTRNNDTSLTKEMKNRIEKKKKILDQLEIISDFSDDEIDENLKEMAENLLKG